ncbi:hypothetical protein Ddye_012116 [Dipteronia dyeriana]|uniref:No apical meristem-associated C-terminal domain-containing protein n=1 Tax=Dipteronia dyeriana TaxID=168575 RepID=A0AAD9X3Q3_9ROSI|nr:hypothetical protein Ddye_012116 [Dipteronia dyeriana]
MEKFADNETKTSPFQPETGHFVSSQEDFPTPESPTTVYPGLSPFSLNISSDDDGGSSSRRPIGVKKAKSKRRVEEQNSADFNTLKERQENFLEFSNRNAMQRERLNDILERKMEYREAKIMMIDLNTITDPNKREFMNQQQLKFAAKRAQQQLKIAAKRAQQQDKGSQNASGSFGDFFENLQGPENGLPDY